VDLKIFKTQDERTGWSLKGYWKRGTRYSARAEGTERGRQKRV